MLLMTETEEGLVGKFNFNRDLFEAATIERMTGHFQILLEGIVADPEQLLWALPLLSAREQQQLLVQWNDTTGPYPQGRCIHELF
jgi:non-ribosomal peptide synthetase component F